jgi:MFS transporter, DHA1 family, multidrug resistance protein
MKDIIRDSTIGQIINRVSGGRYLPYSDQRSDYSIPSHFILPSSTTEAKLNSIDNKRGIISPESSTHGAKSPRGSGGSLTRLNTPTAEGAHHDDEKGEVKKEPLPFDPYLVGWNGDDDPDNPRCVHSVVYLNLFSTVCGCLATGLS